MKIQKTRKTTAENKEAQKKKGLLCSCVHQQ